MFKHDVSEPIRLSQRLIRASLFEFHVDTANLLPIDFTKEHEQSAWANADVECRRWSLEIRQKVDKAID